MTMEARVDAEIRCLNCDEPLDKLPQRCPSCGSHQFTVDTDTTVLKGAKRHHDHAGILDADTEAS